MQIILTIDIGWRHIVPELTNYIYGDKAYHGKQASPTAAEHQYRIKCKDIVLRNMIFCGLDIEIEINFICIIDWYWICEKSIFELSTKQI